eukprot:g2937.t1
MKEGSLIFKTYTDADVERVEKAWESLRGTGFAAARKLVLAGPLRNVQHPLYQTTAMDQGRGWVPPAGLKDRPEWSSCHARSNVFTESFGAAHEDTSIGSRKRKEERHRRETARKMKRAEELAEKYEAIITQQEKDRELRAERRRRRRARYQIACAAAVQMQRIARGVLARMHITRKILQIHAEASTTIQMARKGKKTAKKKNKKKKKGGILSSSQQQAPLQ